ncbi:hypothetical protein ACQP10_38325 (plasmid) [Streptosporangium sandarakinum]|uniref:hypothetical protein n=1 Tax=Streptosporangium sandarakinum TaxID=1260955 RepID=UPI003D8B8617
MNEPTVIEGAGGGSVAVGDAAGAVTLRTQGGGVVTLSPREVAQVMDALAQHGRSARRHVAGLHAKRRRLLDKARAGGAPERQAWVRGEVERITAELERWGPRG